MRANPTKTWKVLTFLNPLDGKNFAYPDLKESDFTFESSELFSEILLIFLATGILSVGIVFFAAGILYHCLCQVQDTIDRNNLDVVVAERVRYVEIILILLNKINNRRLACKKRFKRKTRYIVSYFFSSLMLDNRAFNSHRFIPELKNNLV